MRWGWKHRIAFVSFFLLSANDGIVKSKSKITGADGHSHFPYALFSVMLMTCLASLCIGVVVTLNQEGMRPGLKKCLDRQSIGRVLPVNGLFQIAFVLKFEALRQLDPDIVSLLSQVNVVLLAVAAKIFFGRRYSSTQWLWLVMVSFSIMVYLATRNMEGLSWSSFWGPLEMKFSTQIQGYSCVVAMCLIEIWATVWAEKFLKGHLATGRRDTPREEHAHFWVQKVHVDISGLIILSFFWFLLGCTCRYESFDLIRKAIHYQQVLDHGVLSGWNLWTIIVLVFSVSKAWLAGWVSKHMDSVVKQIGSCVALILTYVEVRYMAGEVPRVQTLLSVSMVLLSIWMFFRASRKPRAAKDGPLGPSHVADFEPHLRSSSGSPSGAKPSDDWVGNYKGPPGPQKTSLRLFWSSFQCRVRRVGSKSVALQRLGRSPRALLRLTKRLELKFEVLCLRNL